MSSFVTSVTYFLSLIKNVRVSRLFVKYKYSLRHIIGSSRDLVYMDQRCIYDHSISGSGFKMFPDTKVDRVVAFM